MSSTYSTNLAIELIGTGDQAGTWGVTTNSNLGTLIEQAISGYVTQAVSTGTDTTITIPNGSTGVARNMYIELTGTGGTNTNLIVPANKKLYFIFNNSTGAVTVKVSGQTGVSVPTGKKMVLVSNGTDIVNGLNYIADFGTNSFTVTNLSATSATITNLIATTASISDASATVFRSASATITNLIATSASITTLTNNPTFGAGTANGVLYLNGSKVATSGSALTFDGTTVLTTPRINITNTGIGATFSSSGGSGMRVYGSSGTNQWDVYLNGANIRFSDNTGGGVVKIDTGAVIDGNVGIGTASPTNYGANYKTLAVNGSSTGIVDVMQNGTVYGQLSTEANVYKVEAVGASTVLRFVTNSTTRATLDSSGNLGLGVTPFGWNSGYKAFDLGSGALMGRASNTDTYLLSNAYLGASTFQYKYSAKASYYSQAAGVHYWYISTDTTPTANNNISFTQAMTLDANGYLSVGATSTLGRFGISGIGGTAAADVVIDSNATYGEIQSYNNKALYINRQGNNIVANLTSGNFGIGTASPGTLLDLGTSTGQKLSLYRNGSIRYGFAIETDTLRYYVPTGASNAVHSFGAISTTDGTTYTERMRLDSSGNLGLGVTPLVWSGAFKVLQASGGAVFTGRTDTNQLNLANNWYYDGGNTSRYIASDFATLYQQFSGQHIWYTAASGTAGNAISFTQAMTLDASGRFLVGRTTSDANGYLTQVNGTSGYQAGLLLTYSGVGSGAIFENSSGALVFGNDNASGTTERARITAGGVFIVGTAPTLYGELLNVTRGGVGQNCATFYFNTTDDRGNLILRHARASGATQAAMIAFLDSAGTERGSIKTDGSATAYNTSSDRRLKENIEQSDDAGEIIDSIQIVKHDWKDGGHVRYGMIAQDLYQVAAEAVSAGDDGEDIEKTWGVDYSKLVPMLVKEMQSLRKRVAELEAK